MLFDKNLKKSQSIITSSYLRYILTLDSKNIILSPFRYPCTWYDNLSKIFLIKRFKKKNLLNFIKIYLKEVLLIVSIMSYKTYGPSIKRKNYKNVYITWFKNGDIQKGLLIKDRYINQKFNKKKDIFFSVNMDKNFKKQNLKNTFILTKTGFFQINTLKNLYHLFNYIFFSLINNNLFHSLNVYSFYSYIFFINFKKCFFDCKFENIYMSYEGQPFQNFIISKIKKLFSEVKIIGLVNSFQPFPIHLYNQKNAPHKIIYCHDYIKDHMVNVLNWKKDNFIKKKKIK